MRHFDNTDYRRTATPKQQALINRLLAEKIVPADAVRLVNRFSAGEDFPITTSEASDLIDMLFAAPRKAGAAVVRPASDKAVAFAKSLLADRMLTADGFAATAAAVLAGDPVEARDVSRLIDALKASPRAERPVDVDASDDPAEGVYLVDGEYVRVHRTRGKGVTVASVAIIRDRSVEWEYRGRRGLAMVAGAAPLSAEQAAAFGRLTGRCVFCTKTLTDERSVSVGYGPTCADHNGLPWGDVAEDVAAARATALN